MHATRQQYFDLQKVFNEILEGEKYKLFFANKNQYDTMRTGLLRKYKRYIILVSSISDNPYEGKFLRSSWDSDEVSGIFYLANESERNNEPGRVYLAVRVTEL